MVSVCHVFTSGSQETTADVAEEVLNPSTKALPMILKKMRIQLYKCTID